MADLNQQPLDNQHSDNDFEKVTFPREDETVKSENSASKVQTGSSAVDREMVEGDRLRKSKLDATQGDQEQLKTQFQDLIYWRNVRKTVLVFGGSLLILTYLACFSLLSLIIYASLFVLTFSFAFRLYGNVVTYFRKSKEAHPLNKYLEKEICIPPECVHKVADQLVESVSRLVDDARRLFLIERFVDTIKFALLLWLMTFIGSWFSGITLIIIGDVFIFTVPKFYSIYQVQIDEFLALVHSKLETTLKAVQEKVKRKKTE